MAIQNNPWQPKQRPIQPQPQMNKPQTLENQAQNALRQMQSNPAFLKTLSEKFKIDSKKEVSASSSVSTAPSSFTSAEGTETSQELGLSFGVKQQAKSEMAPRIRRANLSALAAVENLAPALGGAAGSPQVAAEVGMAAGLKSMPKGGGVLGAVVAKELSFGSKRDAAASEIQKSKAAGSPGKGPAIFLNHVHHPVMLGPSQTSRPSAKAPATPESLGQKKLSEALQSAAGKIGEFLKQSDVGKALRKIEGLPEALAAKAQKRIDAERLIWNF